MEGYSFMTGQINTFELSEYVELAKSANENKRAKGNTAKCSGDSSSYGFAGYTENLADAINVLHKGYKEASNKMQLNNNVGSGITKKNRLSTVGIPVVPLAIQGRPMCMLQRVNTKTTQSKIKIYVNISYNAGITADEIISFSNDILNFAESARANKQVEIYVLISVISKECKYYTDIVKIYDSTKCNSTAVISFALCHPAMLRRLFFARVRAIENYKATPGLGTPHNPTIEEMRTIAKKGDYYINAPEYINSHKQYRPDFLDAII